jgi:hypothetical protein
MGLSGFLGYLGLLSYYQEEEIVYIEAHHPLVLNGRLVRGTEVTGRYIFMENREIPILHKSSGLWPKIPSIESSPFCLSVSPDKQKMESLCVLCGSVVNANNFVLSL